jgi:hypothetical protein
MAARLAWLKVVDADRYRTEGGRVRPGLDNVVELIAPAPAEAAPFLILRAWDDVDGAFTETWRIEEPYGRTLYEGVEREILTGFGSAATGGVADEIAGHTFEYADKGFQVVVEVDGREVARADFEVREPEEPITTP